VDPHFFVQHFRLLIQDLKVGLVAIEKNGPSTDWLPIAILRTFSGDQQRRFSRQAQAICQDGLKLGFGQSF
jgi:hypothetical protein